MIKQGGARVIFVNRFFYPDESATAQILSDLAADLSARGWQVRVITSRLSYGAPDVRLAPTATWHGVAINRIATTGFGRASLAGRAVDYVSFYVSCFFSVLKWARQGDVVVVKTDPPLLSVPIGLAARLKRAPTVNWLQDLFPEVADVLGLGLVRGRAGTVLRALRNRSLKRARMNVAIGAAMAALLESEGIDPARVITLANFTDDETLRPDPPGWERLRAAWGFAPGDFVLGYSGNLGRAHDVETILGAAQRLADQKAIKFLFTGAGHLKAQVEAQASERGLTSIVFRPYQPREALAQSLSVPDMHWISLLPGLEGLIVPSKLYGVAAVARPVIMIGAKDGEIGSLIDRYQFGACVSIGDVEALAALVSACAQDKGRVADMGARARLFIDTHAARRLILARWSALLDEVSQA